MRITPLGHTVEYANRYRVIGIDPGTNCTGFSVLDHDLVTRETYVLVSHTFFRRELLKSRPWLAETYGDRPAAILAYNEVLRDLLLRFDPTAVASETPYMSRLVSAFRALTEQLTSFRTTIYNWDRTQPLYEASPSSVKENLAVPGNSGEKELMREAIRSRDDLYFPDPYLLDALDEHSVDSIAVALHHIDKIARFVG